MSPDDRDIDDLIGGAPTKRKNKGGRPVADHRQKLVLAQAKLANLRAKKLGGELVPAAAVANAWAGIAHDVRGAVMAVPARLLAKLPHLTPADIDIIETELRASLAALARDGGPPSVV